MFNFSSGLLFEPGGGDDSSFAFGALGAGGGGTETITSYYKLSRQVILRGSQLSSSNFFPRFSGY